MTAAENQRFSVEEARLGVVSQVHRYGIETTLVMHPLQTLVADGDEFRFVVCGTRRLGKPLHTAGPEHVCLTMPHAVDAVFQFLVGVDGNMPGKILIALHRGEGVVTTIFRVLGLGNQTAQHCLLQCLSLVLMLLQLQLARLKHLSYYTSNTHLKLRISRLDAFRVQIYAIPL